MSAEAIAFEVSIPGREVDIELVRSNVYTQEALNVLWSLAVPLKFTPDARFPVATWSGVNRFRFLGPWQIVLDRALAEGRGDRAWNSLFNAVHADVGIYSGHKQDEIFVQTQLHRLGLNPGPIDGVIGARTATAIEALGLKRGTLAKVAVDLQTREPAPVPVEARQAGYVSFPGREVTVETFGEVRAVQTGSGAAVTVDGPGRVVVDIGRVV